MWEGRRLIEVRVNQTKRAPPSYICRSTQIISSASCSVPSHWLSLQYDAWLIVYEIARLDSACMDIIMSLKIHSFLITNFPFNILFTAMFWALPKQLRGREYTWWFAIAFLRTLVSVLIWSENWHALAFSLQKLLWIYNVHQWKRTRGTSGLTSTILKQAEIRGTST